MVDFGLSEEHRALARAVREFTHDQVAPVIGDYYERGEFPYKLISELAELGVFGLTIPEEYGGSGGDFLAFTIVLEELAKVDSSIAVTLEVAVGLSAVPLYRFGTEQQKRQWLPKLCSGEMLGAFGLTEPGGGTDAGATRTRAVLDGDEWVINGSKAFITNSGTDITGLITITAVTGADEAGHSEISAIMVPAGTPGLTVGKEYSKVGWRAADTHELSFSNCRVPRDNLLGQIGRGYAQFLQTLDDGRVALAAVATGLAQGCLDESVRYAQQREAFGRPIGANQSVAFMLADMEVRAHTARLAYYDAAARIAVGQPVKKQAAVAKLHAADAAVCNARDATQIHGGYGFMNEFPVARMWRDAKILEIGEGTNETQRAVIARELGFAHALG